MSERQPGLAAQLVQEVVRTPAARELLAELLQPPTAEEAAALTRALLAGDPAVGLRGLASLPATVNAALGVLDAVARSLEPLPPPLLAQVLGALGEGVEVDALAAATDRWHRLLARLVADPEVRGATAGVLARGAHVVLGRVARLDGASLEPVVELLVELLGRIDFGRVRTALETASTAGARALPRVVERAVSDPVLVANAVGCVPPLANAVLGLGAHALEHLRLPNEVLASALFNLLDSLDTKALSRLLNAAGALVAAAHEGNLVLGRHEPALRPVLTRALGELVRQTDHQLAARVALALAEDMETVLGAAGDLLCAEPELLFVGLAGGLAAAEAGLRGLAGATEKLSGLPEATLRRVAQELDEGLERLWGQRDRLAPLLAALARPALRIARRELAAVDPDRAGEALGRALAALAEHCARRPGLLEGILTALDSEETGRALEATLRGLGAGLAARPRLGQALLGPVVEGARHALLDYVKGLPRRVPAWIGQRRRRPGPR